MGIQDVIRWLVPKDEHFFDILEKQATTAREGVAAFKDERDVAAAGVNMQAWEHKGDKLVHELEESLAKTFVTPIDREDIHLLSSALDDILDLANGAARACQLFGVTERTPAMQELLAILHQCTEVVDRAIPNLRKHAYAALVDSSRELRKLEKEGDRVYKAEVSRLFHDQTVDAKVLLREKAVLDDLENALDHCDGVASILANLAVKHA
ncbi:MAG: DUF47 family protein [Myxococcales bacterium]|jgi:uncharacterized protein Yka (UPF0111/DUF47 family)|nr:DUF47 family protein [Myxococcales bacterium]MBL0195189.1 DUF47 family protein [Myxococcales bacterium]HQY60191.1 DUF47 family protein [Polyangiaceae bacterium]